MNPQTAGATALTTEELFSLITLVFIVIGGVFAWVQWKSSNRLKRAEFINQLTEHLRSDQEICETILLFDYDHDWYNANFHNGCSGLEMKVDKTLSFFSYICHLRRNKLITKNDFKFFQYELTRISQNESVTEYFYNLHHFAQKHASPMTFQYLLDYCLPKYPSAFQDSSPQQKRYHKYLNF